jgi:hypothetical protein
MSFEEFERNYCSELRCEGMLIGFGFEVMALIALMELGDELEMAG